MTIAASISTSVSRAPSKLLIAIAALGCVAAGDAQPLAGMWGANNALLALDAQGGRLQVGCTFVRFDPVRPGANGQFSVNGKAEELSAKPLVAPGDDDADVAAPAGKPATLTGRFANGAADLSLTVEGQPVRQIHLMLGQRGTQARCL